MYVVDLYKYFMLQELYKVAQVQQLIQQVQLISFVEGVIHSPITLCLPRRLRGYIKNTFSGLRNQGRYFTVRALQTSPLPANLILLLYQHTNE